jgi:hypothetical protein
MYNTHRGMVPAPNSRLTELLDQLRQEFENQSRSTGEFEHQCMFLICLLYFFGHVNAPTSMCDHIAFCPSVLSGRREEKHIVVVHSSPD